MPGIYGLVSSASAQDVASLGEAMSVRLKHYSWYREHSHQDVSAGLVLGRVSLGFVNTAEQPAYNEDRTLLAVMDGEVHDYDQQRRALTAAGHRFQGDSHAELLLHGYEAEGQAFFRTLHGTFAAVIWDTQSRQLTLLNDPFGMKPLYYAQLPGKLLFASEIKALLADPDLSCQINPRGLAQFFTFGQLLGNDTLLADVHLLPAAGWLTYREREGQRKVESYARLEVQPSAPGRKEEDWLEEIDAAFKRAVDRRTHGTAHLGLSLSGGLDSRAILGVIDPDCPITSVSMGMEGSIDHRAAQEMARLANRPHHQYFLNAEFLDHFEQHMRHMVHLTDGQYMCQCIVMPTLPFYRELGIEVLLRGHAGELMHMDKAYSFSLERPLLALRDSAALEPWLFRRMQMHMLEGVGDTLFAPSYRDQLGGLARQSLQECLRECAEVEPPIHQVWHLFLRQRTRRETAQSMVEFGSLVETRLPYLDSDLIRVLLAAPPDLKWGDKIQAHILRRSMPAFLNVVNANTGARVGAGPVSRFFSKVRLKVFSKLGVRGYQPYERLGLWLREQVRPLVERLLLSERCLQRGIFNPPVLKTVVQDHLSARRNHTYLLLALMIFELGQREFIDGDGEAGGSRQRAEAVPSTEY
jgi:asparagine synthase (glutamine-hydrolysing)